MGKPVLPERRIREPGYSDVCAVCWYDHADTKIGTNRYHHECLHDLKREFHRPPDRIVPMNRTRVP